MKRQNQAYLYALAAILCWSTVAVAFKIALWNISTVQLLAISCYTSVTCMFFYLLFQKKLHEIWLVDRKFIIKSALYGFLNPFLYYLILFKAYTLLPAQIAQPLNYTWPLILVILSILFLRQKISKQAIWGIFISFLGVIIISLQGNFNFSALENSIGVVFSIGSSFIWALYWLLNAKRDKYEETGLFLNFLFAGIYITILILIIGNLGNLNLKGVFAAIYVGIFEMGFTFVLWLKALKLSKDTSKVSHLVYFSPFISLFFIHVLLKENIYFTTFLGLTFIISGILLSKIKRKHKIDG